MLHGLRVRNRLKRLKVLENGGVVGGEGFIWTCSKRVYTLKKKNIKKIPESSEKRIVFWNAV